jgi:uncharacterized membrane protein YobD (UPF0266 family)
MKLIDVDSKATLDDFLTVIKRLNLYSFYIIQITNDNSIFRKDGIYRVPFYFNINTIHELLTLCMPFRYTLD